MIFKNIINYFNIFQLIFYIVYIYILNKFFITNKILIKFFLLFLNFFIISSIGLYYNLDGIVMIFLVCEFTILLIFLTLFFQIYSYTKELNNSIIFIVYIVLLFLNVTFYELNIINYKNFYSYYNIVLNDFYYIYNMYFEKQILITIFILFIITLYSIFFILTYFKLKIKNLYKKKRGKDITLLRKQNLIHQTNYNTKIRIFK